MKRVAVIGGGQIFETVHNKAIEVVDDAQLVAIVEVNPVRRGELEQLFPNVQVYDNIDTMIEFEQITDAIVCVPNKFHCTTTIKLLEAKINVLCEKPPAISSKEAKKMYDAATKNGVGLYYNFHLRQIDGIENLKEEIKTSYHVDIKALRRRGIPGWGSFTNLDMQGGGALIDLGIHYLDLALFLLDEYHFDNVVSSMSNYIGKHESNGDFGTWNPTKFEVENFCSASLQGNQLVNLVTSFAHNMSEKNVYEITFYTETGRIELLKQEKYDTIDQVQEFGTGDFDQNELRINSSINFLNGTYTKMCDGYHGYKIQTIIEQIYTNARSYNE